MDEHALRVLEFKAIQYQLAAQAACSLGREKAEAIAPSDYLPQAQARLNETTECRNLIDTKGNLPLGGVTDIRAHIKHAELGRSLDPRELLDVLGLIMASRSLRSFLLKIASDYPIMAEKAGALGQYPSLESEIGSCIGPNGSVLDSASPELARIRSRKKVAANRMLERINSIISGPLRSLLQDPVIVQRGDRYCVPVKADHRGAFGGIVHDTSASGATLFMEPQAVVDLGNEIKELSFKEVQEVEKILARLTDGVRRIAGSLVVTVATLGEIDFISARARLSIEHRAVEPILNRTGRTRLLSARHPLLDPAIVVPTDVEIGAEDNQIVLITGPNTGGKTVTLKTVGLLTLMAQSGLHVPASLAEMNVFYQVFADIGDEQSIQQSLSTFSGHMTNIVRILKHLRKNALVLLDEVGAGTDPGEGASLARAILNKLREAGARVIATTHYGELKTYAFLTKGVQNSSVEFDDSTLSPTYRLLQGVPGSSNAYAIAGRLGMPESILDEARHVLTGSDETADLLRELEDARRKAVSDAREAERARVEAQMLRRRYQEELGNLENLRREAKQHATDEARVLLRRAQDKVDNIITELRSATTEGKQTERARQAISNIESELQTAIEQQSDSQQRLVEITLDRPFRKGDRVRLSSLGMVGEVLDDPRDGDLSLPVQVGAMRVSVPISTLRMVEEQRAHSSSPASREQRASSSATREAAPREKAVAMRAGGAPSNDEQSIGMQKALTITPQLTLLGQRAEEAVQNVEKYLDDAYAAGMTRARLVHGKGTGALRRAVQEYLRDHPLVSAFAIADAEEGGAGATVVTLKET